MDIKTIFTPSSPYKKRARTIAILWTLLIFIACFTPAKEIPKVDVPFIDKWTHLVLFGVFALLWLCAYPTRKLRFLFFIFLLCVFTGSFIEIMQGVLAFLGRSCELLDAVADSVGGIIGIFLFYLSSSFAAKRIKTA